MSASVYNVGINRYRANFKQLSMCMYTQLFLREHFLPSNFCPTNSCILSCFFQLSRYLPFLYYTTMTTGHYNLLSICIITFFNVIIVFLNKITNHTVPIFNFLSNENNSSILHWPLWNKFVYHFTNRRIITLKANGKWKS